MCVVGTWIKVGVTKREQTASVPATGLEEDGTSQSGIRNEVGLYDRV